MDEFEFFMFLIIVLMIGILGVLLYTELVYIKGMEGKVTDVSAYYYSPTATAPHYVVQLGGGRYYEVGVAAGKNLQAGECYLLRMGAFSEVYNLFEPIKCKEEW